MLNKKEEGVDQNYITVGEVLDPDSWVAVDRPSAMEGQDRWGVVWAEAMELVPLQVIIDPESTTTDGIAASTVSSPGAGAAPDKPPHPLPALPEPTAPPLSPSPQAPPSSTATPDAPAMSAQYCCGLSILLGQIFSVIVVTMTYSIELVAALLYCMAAGCHAIRLRLLRKEDLCCPYYAMRHVLTSVIRIIVAVLSLSDLLLLLCSVFLSEVVGWIGWLTLCLVFCPLTATTVSSSVAAPWRFHWRRLAHLIRWAFRGFHQDWQLPRKYSFCCGLSSAHRTERKRHLQRRQVQRQEHEHLQQQQSSWNHHTMPENVVIVDSI